MVLWHESLKLVYRDSKGYLRTVWCLPLRMVPFACGNLDWKLVSAERQAQLRQLIDEATDTLNQVHMHLVDKYRLTRKTVFDFLTTMDGTEGYWRAKAERIAPRLDEAIRDRFLHMINEGCGIIAIATTHARTITKWQSETPIIDIFSMDEDGMVTNESSMPLLPVTPQQECDQFFASVDALKDWYQRFDAFLQENRL